VGVANVDKSMPPCAQIQASDNTAMQHINLVCQSDRWLGTQTLRWQTSSRLCARISKIANTLAVAGRGYRARTADHLNG